MASILEVLSGIACFSAFLLVLKWSFSKRVPLETEPAAIKARQLPLPPGPWSLPFIGETVEFLKLGPPAAAAQRFAKFGPIFRTSMLGEPIVFFSDPDAARKVFLGEHTLVEQSWLPATEAMLGPESVSTAYFDTHTKLRKLLNPTYSPRAVASYTPLLVATAETFCSKWLALGHINGHDEIKGFTFKVAVDILLGFDDSWTTEENLKKAHSNFLAWVDGLFALPINLPGTTFNKALKARKELSDAVEASILKLQARESKKPADAQLGEGVKSTAQIVLEARDEEGKPLPMSTLKDVCLNIMFAGYDTSASALMLLMQLIKKHPQVEKKLREEQAQVIAKHGSEINTAAMKEMVGIENAIKEAMRYQPIISGLYRRALQTFPLMGYQIPKGMKLGIALDQVVKSDPAWKNQTGEMSEDSFFPDRWLTEEGQKKGGLQAFGAGPRMCLGYNLALAEMKIFLAVVLRRLDWELVNPDEEFKAFPLPVPKQNLMMNIRPLPSKPEAS